MTAENEINQRFGVVRKKLGLTLVINWLIPLVLVLVLHRFLVPDTIALAIAGAIPALRTITLLVWRRRVEWIGVFGVFGFVVAFAVSTFSGGSSLPLKLYHPIITGIFGLICLGSVVIGKPLLLIILRALKYSGGSEQFSVPESNKKFTMITAFIGCIFFVDAVIHFVMALTLPTVTYLSMSRVVTIVCVLVLVIIGRFARGRGQLLTRRRK